MSTSNIVVRSMHDIGAAAWFGGSLMGALGVNGAADEVEDSKDRARVAAAGWAKWAPINAAAIGLHAIGGLGLILENRGRVAHQSGVGANTAVKTVITLAAAGVTFYSGALGAKVGAAGQDAVTAGATTPTASTPKDVAAAQKNLKITQWVIPVLTGAVVLLGTQQGEQQRTTAVTSGIGKKVAERLAS